jgi:hypothetical protein
VWHASTPKTCPYSVGYNFIGFFKPVDNLPTLVADSPPITMDITDPRAVY